jgi:hypothetical protein
MEKLFFLFRKRRIFLSHSPLLCFFTGHRQKLPAGIQCSTSIPYMDHQITINFIKTQIKRQDKAHPVIA